MSRMVLDFNPVSGEAVYFEFDPETERATITHSQDPTYIIERNKKFAKNLDYTRRGVKNDMLHYATIPNGVIVKWKQELGVDVFDPNDRRKMFSLLNSPDYKYLKTTTINHDR